MRRTPDSFLLTSLADVADIIEQQRRCRTSTIQLTDYLESDAQRELRAALPGIRIVQVIHVLEENVIQEAREIACDVDAILLDSGNPNLEKKELGGTGRIHDWDISRRIIKSVNVPVFLAGGLNEQNVSEAIQIVRPYGVDVCNGVRTNGHLDEAKLSAFFEKVRCGKVF